MRCHSYSPAELRKKREERLGRQREHEQRVERRRKAAEAAERLRLERNARINAQRERERQVREKWRREHPDEYRRQRQRQQRLERERRKRDYNARLERERMRLRRLRAADGTAGWSEEGWIEVGLGPGGRVADGGDGISFGGGFAASVGVFWRRGYEGRSMLGPRSSLAIAAVPVMGPLMLSFVVPKSSFVGNELGVTLSMDLAWATSRRFDTLLLLEPRLRVSPSGQRYASRWRINSLLGVLVPKVGFEISSDGTLRWALECGNLAFAYALTEHVAVELEAALLVREGSVGERASVGGNVRLKLLVF
jgi:hypothetical protein